MDILREAHSTPILPVIQKLAPEVTIDVSLRGLPMLLKTLPEVGFTSFSKVIIFFKWEIKNKQSLAELIVDFFEYYAKFDWENDVISVRLGKTVGMHDANLLKPGNFLLRFFELQPLLGHNSLVDKHIRIEEPFDGTNTARAVFDMTNYIRIKFAFIHVAKILRRAQEAGADIYQLLEKEIRPVDDEIEVNLNSEIRERLIWSRNCSSLFVEIHRRLSTRADKFL